jgi:hypothetical protein
MFTSIKEPLGANIVKRFEPLLTLFQKEASDNRGGLEFILAGIATEFDESETSFAEVLALPSHVIEHVEADPCAGGGAQILIEFILTLLLKGVTEVFATLVMTPAAERRLIVLILVAVALADVNLNT